VQPGLPPLPQRAPASYARVIAGQVPVKEIFLPIWAHHQAVYPYIKNDSDALKIFPVKIK
jgi:hypothetical protein